VRILPFVLVFSACGDAALDAEAAVDDASPDDVAQVESQALALPVYGWPLQPFDRQHPVRGNLNDPRCPDGYDGAPQSQSFHFGIDIAGDDGTAVFAVEPGMAVRQSPEVVAVVSDSGLRTFSYWHIVPVITARRHVAKGDLLGTIAAGWGHVHLGEVRQGVYLNPLRKGALTPYFDFGAPELQALEARPVGAGRVDLIVDAIDHTPVRVTQAGWGGMPVTPALIRFRITRGETEVVPWTVAVDLRSRKLENARFKDVFAPMTDQNHPDDPGRYRFWVRRGFDTRGGAYTVEVEASDIRGNTRKRSWALAPTP
jgi:hypothetical protein